MRARAGLETTMAAASPACPRDGSVLAAERMHGIEVERCPSCRGVWLDAHELGELEAKRADEETRRGMVGYAQRASELRCPACGNAMTAFNYRGHHLELDTCDDEHGYWLDAGEDREVLAVIEARRRGLRRVPAAEAAWHAARRGGRGDGGGLMGGLRRFFGR